MANAKKRRKILVFTIILVVIAGLSALAILKKREVVITVQTEKVARRNLTEIVVANGKIQPVLQVKISAEVSGEIIDLPVKEGQYVKKGDLMVKIKPDFYIAQLHQVEASYESSLAAVATAAATLRKAEAEYKRTEGLFKTKLVSDSTYDEAKASYDVAKAQLESATHQVEMSKASVDSAKDSLDKTTIVAPLNGTISKLNSRLGERVLGTVQNLGTEIMTIADLNEMETRVDIGENDVVLIEPGQKVRLEVDAFKNRKFSGTVTEIANSSNDSGALGSLSSASSSSSQEATKFQVRVRIIEKEAFRPGMSVTAEIETRSRTNVLTVPIASITTRMPKEKDKPGTGKNTNGPGTAMAAEPGTNATGSLASNTNSADAGGTNAAASDKKSKEMAKAVEVVFVMDGDHAKMIPVKIGISDDNYWEITEGLTENQEVVSGSYKAVNRELEDGKKIKKGAVGAGLGKEEDGKKKN
jgi:HlyD family secretion protein